MLLWSDVQGPSATSVVLRSIVISEDMRIVLGLNSIYHLPLEHEAIISFTHLESKTELQAWQLYVTDVASRPLLQLEAQCLDIYFLSMLFTSPLTTSKIHLPSKLLAIALGSAELLPFWCAVENQII